MILVDSNILMYAAGAEHPNKAASVDLLQEVAEGKVNAAVDADFGPDSMMFPGRTAEPNGESGGETPRFGLTKLETP